LAQTVDTDGTVEFQWDPVTQWGADASAGHYQLWIANSAGGSYSPIGPQVTAGIETVTIAVGECSAQSPTLCAANGQDRFYVVTAENSLGLVSGYSNEVGLRFEVGPATPLNLTVTASGP
jgi:hypothetical protein